MVAAMPRRARRPDRPLRPRRGSDLSTAESDSRPVARLSTPGEIAAAVPLLCGFVPSQSLVVLSLRGPRKRIGLTMRFDLAWCDATEEAPDEIADRLALDGASAVALVVFTEQADPPPRESGPVRPSAALIAAVDVACAERGVALTEAVLVRGGRWSSYLCTPPCCPDEGLPLDLPTTSALQLLGATAALDGRRVLGSREELEQSVAAPQMLAAAAARQHLEQALLDRLRLLAEQGQVAAHREALAVARTAVGHSTTAAGVAPDVAARLAVAVRDKPVRDEVATWVLTRPDALLAALTQSMRRVVPPLDAELGALLAWVAYAEGDGGLANVALDRALRSDPACSLGLLVREALDAQLPPAAVREVLEQTRQDLLVRTPGSPTTC